MTEQAAATPTTITSRLRALPGFVRRNARLGGLSLWALAGPMIGGTVLLASIGVVAPWLREHGPAAVVLFAAFAAVGGSLAIVPTYALSLVGGWSFGTAGGFLATWVGLNVAASCAYLITRRLGAEHADRLLARWPRARSIREALVGTTALRAAWIMTLLRLPPVFPFAMTNLSAAVVRTPWVAFAVGTAIGLVPRTAAIVYIGSTLSELNLNQPRDLRSAALSIALTIAVLFVITRTARNALARQ